MAQHARSGVDSAATAVLEGRRHIVGGRAAHPADFGRLLAQMLGAQFRHGLAIGAALERTFAWAEILRAQTELLHASLGHRRRADGEAGAQPDRVGPTAGRAQERPIPALVGRHGPVVVQAEETVLAAAERMAEQACGGVLVCNGDRPCGIFTGRDLMVRVIGRGLDPGMTPLAEVMSREPDRIESMATAQESAWRADGPAHLLPVETPAGMLLRLEQWRVLAERMR